MKKILIIGAGILQIPAIIEAKKMGLKVVAFDYDKNAPGFKIADEAYVISTIDIENAVKKAKEIKPDGVMTLASDMPLRTVAAIANELNLPSVSEETAYAATNKARMREILQENGVPIPIFYKINTKLLFDEKIKQFIDRQFIVKPADNSGSRGVGLCDVGSDMDKVYNYSMLHSRSGEILIEEYMTGQEVSVETFAINGQINIIAITDKITTGAPYFVEIGHSQPSTINSEIQREICEVAIAANKALNILNGPSHVEIIVTQDGPKVVEIGARLGGDNITSHLVPLSSGINLVKATIQYALNEDPDIKRTKKQAAVINYFKSPTGIITSIRGIEEIRKFDGVVEVQIAKNVGEEVAEIRNSSDRIGYYICSGESLNELYKLGKIIEGKVSITVNKQN